MSSLEAGVLLEGVGLGKPIYYWDLGAQVGLLLRKAGCLTPPPWSRSGQQTQGPEPLRPSLLGCLNKRTLHAEEAGEEAEAYRGAERE